MLNKQIATLFHISDLHFGNQFFNNITFLNKIQSATPLKNFSIHDYQVACALANRINSIKIDRKDNDIPCGVVFTGDLTASGKKHQFTTGSNYLRSKIFVSTYRSSGLDLGIDRVEFDHQEPSLVFVPGNHDIWRRKLPSKANYSRYFPDGYPKQWKIKTNSKLVYLHGLYSIESNFIKGDLLARGYVDEKELNNLVKRVRDIKKENRDSIHIVFLHHPLINISSSGIDPSMNLENRETVRSKLYDIADIVLSGHSHNAEISDGNSVIKWPANAIVGTTTQMLSSNNFLLIDVYDNELCLEFFDYNDQWKQFLPRPGGPKIIKT